MHQLAKRIREAREKAGLTQKQLADAFGYKPQTVSGWERGEENSTKPNAPNPQTLAKIASITGVSLKWLLTGVEETVTGVTIPSTEQVAGRIVPSVQWAHVRLFVGGDRAMSEGYARSHYPCGPNSFRTIAIDKANHPDIEPGDSLIIDPEQTPLPGDYCLVVFSNDLILRRYRPRRDHVELVPYNSDFETVVVPVDEVEVIGTMTERVKPRRI
jgi:transcriptional regulator with XRE-family HTH domain